jgi:hypothetical protein
MTVRARATCVYCLGSWVSGSIVTCEQSRARRDEQSLMKMERRGWGGEGGPEHARHSAMNAAASHISCTHARLLKCNEQDRGWVGAIIGHRTETITISGRIGAIPIDLGPMSRRSQKKRVSDRRGVPRHTRLNMSACHAESQRRARWEARRTHGSTRLGTHANV